MKLYKYVSPERVDILERQLIRFSQPAAFNDPFEMKPHIEAIASPEYIDAKSDNEHEQHIQKAYNSKPLSFRRKVSFDKCKKDFDKDALREKLKQESVGGALDQVRESLSIAINSAVGILSLTETPDNLLMWAHYAKSHTGMVLEFETDHKFFNQEFPKDKTKACSPTGFDEDLRRDYGHLTKVKYSQERPKITISDVKSFELFLIKGCEWKYEYEWRMLMPLSFANETIQGDGISLPTHLFHAPSSAITKVILGERATDELETKIKNILGAGDSTKHIALERMELDPIAFKLNAVSLC